MSENFINKDAVDIQRQYRLVGKNYVDYKQIPIESLDDLHLKDEVAFDGLVITVLNDSTASGATREYVCKLSGDTPVWEPLYLTPAQTIAEIYKVTKFRIEVYDSTEELPKTGESNVLYLIRVVTPGSEIVDYFAMFIWVPNEERYEFIGTTEAKDYYKKSETYNRTEIDAKVDAKQDTLVSQYNIKTINGISILMANSGDTKNIEINNNRSFYPTFNTSGTCVEFCESILACSARTDDYKVSGGMTFLGGVDCGAGGWPSELSNCECLVRVIENDWGDLVLSLEVYSSNKEPYIWDRIYYKGFEMDWLPNDAYNRVHKSEEASIIYGTNENSEQIVYHAGPNIILSGSLIDAVAYDDTEIREAISATTVALEAETAARIAADSALDSKKQDVFALSDGLIFSGATETEDLTLILDMVPYTRQEIEDAILSGIITTNNVVIE